MDVKSWIRLLIREATNTVAARESTIWWRSRRVVHRVQSKLGYLQHLFLSFLSAYNHLTIFMSKRHNTIQHRVIRTLHTTFSFINIELAAEFEHHIWRKPREKKGKRSFLTLVKWWNSKSFNAAGGEGRKRVRDLSWVVDDDFTEIATSRRTLFLSISLGSISMKVN